MFVDGGCKEMRHGATTFVIINGAAHYCLFVAAFIVACLL